MSCSLWDVPCHVGSFLAPVQAFWATWWWLGLFDLGLILGAFMGPRIVIALNTIGFGWWLYDRFKPVPEPIETDLSPRDREPAPKKPKPILADTSIFEDFMTRLRKKR